MNKKRFQDRPWYPYAIAGCIAVILFVALTHCGAILQGIGEFIGFFSPVILGCVIAYIVNPLAKLYCRILPGNDHRPGRRRALANALAFLAVVLFLIFALMILLPQLVESASTFVGNLDDYTAALNGMLENWGLSSRLDLSKLISSSENLLGTVADFVTDNLDDILNISVDAGRVVVKWLIAFMLSIYLLGAKDRLKAGCVRLLKALMRPEPCRQVLVALRRCNVILSRYIVFNLVDALIVGAVNAIFMSVLRLPYVGLVSFFIGVTNLIPTFGPVIGIALGAFVLVLVKPWHALIFIIFSLVLQLLDSYVLKPRLFGDTLGVSSLWILVGIIVGGRMFGITGILLAIPAVAILDFLYKEHLLPWLEQRRARKDRPAGPSGGAEEAAGNDPPCEN